MGNKSVHSVRVLNQELCGNDGTGGRAKDGNSFGGKVGDQGAGFENNLGGRSKLP